MAMAAVDGQCGKEREIVGAGKGQLLEQLTQVPVRFARFARPLAFAVSIKLYNSALAVAPRGLPGEQPVLAADHEWSDRLLAGVVVRR